MPFTLFGPRWDAGAAMASVTWAADASIPTFFMSEIRDAFATWSRYANINFTEVANAPGVEITFQHNAIDGASNVLARASTAYNGASYQVGTVRFDSGDGWRVDGDHVETNRDTSDLYAVALHEIGHSIGIDHNATAPMIMNSSIPLYQIHDLTIHDIQAAQAIYGARAGAPAFDATTGFNTAVVPTYVPPIVPAVVIPSTSGVLPLPTLVVRNPVDPGIIPTPTTPAIPQVAPDPIRPTGIPTPVTPTAPLEDTTDPVFRFYDTKTNDHFYTAGVAERDAIIKNVAHYKYEGVAFETPDKALDTVDVFRFYNTATDAHFFTSSVGERDSVIKNLATYKYEGVAFQAYASPEHADAVVLDRFYNTATKMHHYSTGGETAGIVAGNAGPSWKLEGKSFVMAKVGSDGHTVETHDLYEAGSAAAQQHEQEQHAYEPPAPFEIALVAHDGLFIF